MTSAGCRRCGAGRGPLARAGVSWGSQLLRRIPRHPRRREWGKCPRLERDGQAEERDGEVVLARAVQRRRIVVRHGGEPLAQRWIGDASDPAQPGDVFRDQLCHLLAGAPHVPHAAGDTVGVDLQAESFGAHVKRALPPRILAGERGDAGGHLERLAGPTDPREDARGPREIRAHLVDHDDDVRTGHRRSLLTPYPGTESAPVARLAVKRNLGVDSGAGTWYDASRHVVYKTY